MKSFLCVGSFSLINERQRLGGEKAFGKTLNLLKKSVFSPSVSVKVSAGLIKRRAEGLQKMRICAIKFIVDLRSRTSSKTESSIL